MKHYIIIIMKKQHQEQEEQQQQQQRRRRRRLQNNCCNILHSEFIIGFQSFDLNIYDMADSLIKDLMLMYSGSLLYMGCS